LPTGLTAGLNVPDATLIVSAFQGYNYRRRNCEFAAAEGCFMTIVPIYAALLAIGYLALAVGVIRLRKSRRISIGVGSDDDLERAVRVHSNFGEYVPFALLLLSMAEMQGASHIVLNILCILLLVGRGAHAWGLSNKDLRFRTVGVVATFSVIAAVSLMLLRFAVK
jgi:uncharacterized protein